MKPTYCPFCAGTKINLNREEFAYYYSCETCGAQGPAADKEQEALYWWNTRKISICEIEIEVVD